MKEITIILDSSQVPQLVNLICSLPNRDVVIRDILNQLAFLKSKPAEKPLSKRKQEWKDQPLGELTDREIAKTMGVTPQRVQQVRSSRGIATSRDNRIDNIDWDAQPLGQMSDVVLCKKIGFSLLIIKEKRKERKIPSFGQYDWDNIPLGKLPDGQIAALIGGTTGNVNLVRRKKGIPAFQPRGTTNWDEQPLGKITDKELADKLKVSANWVAQQRKLRQIPAKLCVRSGKRLLVGAKAFIQADWDNLPLGKIPDQTIANDIGCSSATVIRRRQERGIPPSRPWKSRSK